MSRKNTQNVMPEEVKEVVEGIVVDAEIVEEVVEPEKKVPFWKRPKVQKVGKIAAVIAAIGGAAVAGVILGKKTTSDDEELSDEDYMDKIREELDGRGIDSAYITSPGNDEELEKVAKMWDERDTAT